MLVTGAGASRDLAREGTSMPLMPDWSDALCEALDQRESGLAQACGLSPGASGSVFEENLGLVLRWHQVQDLAERFRDLGGPHPGSRTSDAEESRERVKRRLDAVLDTLNTTLYELFGLERIDDRRASEAYGTLLTDLSDPELVVATTNYDRSAEVALEALGHTVEAGFPAGTARTPVLQATGMIRNRGGKTVVIHLHGAVGWYERGGRVESHYGDQPYRSSLGAPVVLYPDPDKDPTGHAIVSQLWSEFREALDWSDHVLVLGHSLHDPALVRELRRVQSDTKIAVSYIDDAVRIGAETQIPKAWPVYLEFGPLPRGLDREEWTRWRDRPTTQLAASG